MLNTVKITSKHTLLTFKVILKKRWTQLTLWMSLKPRLMIFLCLFIIYTSVSGPRLLKPSGNNHFAYLAYSFLHGQTSLISPPPHHNDWASYQVLTLHSSAPKHLSSPFKGIPLKAGVHLWKNLNGTHQVIKPKWVKHKKTVYYVSFPPLPAILMLPLVALFGLQASDVWLTLIFASLNGVFLFDLLQKLNHTFKLNRSKDEWIWFILLLTLGSAHWWCSVSGQVWFTALIIGVTCQLLFLRFALQMTSPIRAGLCLACAFSTRASLILYALFFYIQVIYPASSYPLSLQKRLKRALLFSIPPLCIGLILLFYNWMRFESISEFGHTYLAQGQLTRIQNYGLFHPVYFNKNLISAFLLLPKIQLTYPYFLVSWHGMSIPFSIPALLWIGPLWIHLLFFRGSIHHSFNKDQVRLIVHSSLTLLCILILLLFYQNTGWVQYTYRFILDFLPLGIVILFCSTQPLSPLFKTMIIWSILIHGLGAIGFDRSFFRPFFINLPHLLPH